jgi:hypothetical protein
MVLVMLCLLPASPVPADQESGSTLLSPDVASTNVTASALLPGLLRGADPGPLDRPRTELSIMDDDLRQDDQSFRPFAAPGESAPGLELKVLGDERELIRDGERWKSHQFVLLPSPALLDTTLLARGEVASVRSDRGGSAFLMDDQMYRLLSLGLEGEWNGFRYGAGYRSVGKKLEKLTRLPPTKRDEEGGEAWVERRAGPGRLRLSFSEFSDNVDRDPRRPRITRVQAGVTTALALASLPTFSLTYRQGSAEREEGGGASSTRSAPARSSLETVLGSIWYGDTTWDIALSSTYTVGTERLQPWRKTFTLSQDVSGSYRPTRTLTLASRVGRGEDWHDGAEARNQTTSAEVSVTCTPPFSVVHLTAVGSYMRTTSSAGFIDGTTTSASASVARSLRGRWWGSGTVAVDVGFSGYRDGVYPDASYREVFGLLHVKVASF